MRHVMEQESSVCWRKINRRAHVSVELSTYRPDTVENNHSLFAHGCQGVWFSYISHDDVHL